MPRFRYYLEILILKFSCDTFFFLSEYSLLFSSLSSRANIWTQMRNYYFHYPDFHCLKNLPCPISIFFKVYSSYILIFFHLTSFLALFRPLQLKNIWLFLLEPKTSSWNINLLEEMYQQYSSFDFFYHFFSYKNARVISFCIIEFYCYPSFWFGWR